MTVTLRGLVYGSLTLVLLLGIWCTGFFMYETQPRQIVSHLLRLSRSPASLREAECESWSVSDVLTTCTFRLDPHDLPNLLTGWRFERLRANGGSYAFSSGPKLGREFPVVVEFSVTDPPAFARGGRVSLVTDASRTRFQVDYYEE